MSLLRSIFSTKSSILHRITSGGIESMKYFSTPATTTVEKESVATASTTNPSPIDEFFDHADNWGESEVRTGRSWRLEELRRKNNGDLHKLWYALLKERNMLLTMKEECDREQELLANPERIDKVDESMENLERVIRERNRAYLELEYGTDGRAPERTSTSVMGFDQRLATDEHVEPSRMHPNGKRYERPYLPDEQYEFQKIWTERLWWKRFYKKDDQRRVKGEHRYLHRW